MDWPLILTGLAVFGARVLDVSLGTIRTIATVQGRMLTAFVLGLFEVTAWLVVITTIVNRVVEQPLLAAFYAFGFSTGNVTGIFIEKRIAMGHVAVKFLSQTRGRAIARTLREHGFRVTIFEGEGATGTVTELYALMPRRKAAKALKIAEEVEPGVFFVTESPGMIRRWTTDIPIRPTGWRAVFKRK
jgi:uncharacterized protein YebE (UPF0316 family)